MRLSYFIALVFASSVVLFTSFTLPERRVQFLGKPYKLPGIWIRCVIAHPWLASCETAFENVHYPIRGSVPKASVYRQHGVRVSSEVSDSKNDS